MKVDISDIRKTVTHWNQVNTKYQESLEKRTVMEIISGPSIIELKRELALIEDACVTKHLFSPEMRHIESRERLISFVNSLKINGLRDALNSYDDSALIYIIFKLSELIPNATRQIVNSIFNAYQRELNEEDQSRVNVYLAQRIIPFLSVYYESRITDKLGKPFNIYVAANIRENFIAPLQMFISQNLNEDISWDDSKNIITSFYESYPYEIDELFKGNTELLSNRLYCMGLLNPPAITEKLCEIISNVFSQYVKDNDSRINNMFDNYETYLLDQAGSA